MSKSAPPLIGNNGHVANLLENAKIEFYDSIVALTRKIVVRMTLESYFTLAPPLIRLPTALFWVRH